MTQKNLQPPPAPPPRSPFSFADDLPDMTNVASPLNDDYVRQVPEVDFPPPTSARTPPPRKPRLKFMSEAGEHVKATFAQTPDGKRARKGILGFVLLLLVISAAVVLLLNGVFKTVANDARNLASYAASTARTPRAPTQIETVTIVAEEPANVSEAAAAASEVPAVARTEGITTIDPPNAAVLEVEHTYVDASRCTKNGDLTYKLGSDGKLRVTFNKCVVQSAFLDADELDKE